MKESAKMVYRSRADGDPYLVLDDPSLSDAQRREVLEDWLQDLLELQTATGESMASGEKELGEVGALYQRVNDALCLARKATS